MLSWLPGILAALLAISLVAAPILYFGRRRAAACGTTGIALAAAAGGSLLALAVNPDPGINATGIGALVMVVALSAFAFRAARTPALQGIAFGVGWIGCLVLAASLAYLLIGFKVF